MRASRFMRAAQKGFTLIELMIVVVLVGVIGAITFMAFTSGQEALGRADDDARGQQDLRITAERLTRDLRAARGVDAGSTGEKLTIWIDTNGDYRRTPAESITWRLMVNPTDSKHFDVQRVDGTGAGLTVGQALVSGIAFSYDSADVTKARIVNVTMTYDAIVDAYLEQKKTTYRVRMRNVQ
jgi:prepilin-type N-terminal cleavage/methylation domain-containing protein